jgi:hypothetical protein
MIRVARRPSTSSGRTGRGRGCDFSKKYQVLSGSAAMTEKPGIDFSEKHQVLSGPPAAAGKRGRPHFSKKHQVLSGSKYAPAKRRRDLLKNIRSYQVGRR